MKILQVNKFFYLKGGSETYLFALVDSLKKEGHIIAEFASRDPRNFQSDWAEYFPSTVDYETNNIFKQVQFAGKIIYSLEAKKKIGKLLDKFRPDIVHLHIFQHQLSASILPEIKKRNIPVVYTAHDLKSVCPNYKMVVNGFVCEECKGHKYYFCLKNKCVKGSYLKSLVNVVEMYYHYLRKYYDMIDLVITPSEFYRNKLIEWRFPADKVIHLPNFVDENEFVPCFEHSQYFIYLGRLSEEKGVLTLLDAMTRVQRGTLIIIGTGPLENVIKKKIEELSISNVKMVGFQSGRNLNKYLSNAMFSIMPSEWYENGPISLLETFACGKPIVGADIGGIPENISHGKDGLIFRAKDPRDLAEKINFLLDNHEKLPGMGRAARDKIEKFYSKKMHIEKITKIYNDLVNLQVESKSN